VRCTQSTEKESTGKREKAKTVVWYCCNKGMLYISKTVGETTLCLTANFLPWYSETIKREQNEGHNCIAKTNQQASSPEPGSAPLCFSATVTAMQSDGTMEYYVDYIWQDGLLPALVANNSKQKVKFTKYNFAPPKKRKAVSERTTRLLLFLKLCLY